MKFTIITVTYNAGDKLAETVSNVLKQSYKDFELLIKDGMSKDGSVDKLPEDPRIRLERCPDKGIYDAMNQAVAMAKGDYVMFMNCGDFFYEEDVLHKIAVATEETPDRGIYYGDAYFHKVGDVLHMPGEITDYVCFSHIPCHQACVFARKLFTPEGFHLKYKIRADYEFFLRQYYTNGVRPFYIGCVIADYEGGGYSETKENRKRDKEEHLEIANKYIGTGLVKKYRMLMIVTLQPLRRWIAQDSPFSGIYDKLKSALYRRKTK